MVGDRDVRPVYDTSYPEPKMEREPFERPLYAAADLADLDGVFCIALHDWFYGQRCDPFPSRPFLSADQRWAFLCQKSAHDLRLLEICTDVSTPGASLEYDDGNSKASIPEGVHCPYMGAANCSHSDCSLRCLCPCKEGYCRLSISEKQLYNLYKNQQKAAKSFAGCPVSVSL